MKLKLLADHQGLKAGAEWNCPWASVGRVLIEEGKALALEECDLHLNPKGGEEGEPDAEPPASEQADAPPVAQKKPAKPKPAKKPKPKPTK